MLLYPSDLKEKLEFSKILDELKKECLSPLTKNYFDKLDFSIDLKVIQRWLNETEEFKKNLERGEHLPLSRFESITEDIYLIKKEGYVLEAERIREIYNILSIGLELTKYFSDIEKVKFLPLINEVVSGIIIDKTLTEEIDRILDDEGEIRPDASQELLKITKSIRNKEREIEKSFNEQLEVYRSKGYLVDTNESIRNGRRVLTVAVEHKRRIPGIIHDESGTGKTVYIEPENVINTNNQLFNLYAERRHELYKILRKLCAFISPYGDNLLVIQGILVKIDSIRSKAIFAYRINAHKPNLQQRPTFNLQRAYNPNLLLKHINEKSTVIPFDLKLYGKNRILVLSGPNAGGKSVALKSVGLLQLMIQFGMLVTADENSIFGVFDKIYVDIGDQQSMEDDLSTYSSHLTNMKVMLDGIDENSLFLIDEFGSGTDPKIGGAIAESILFELNKKKTFGIVTTHYSNLKFFAYKTQGIVNGSMEFDTQLLLPTYKMHIGKPGSSFAFEIAQKIGLDPKILNYARHKTGKNEKAIDELLVTLMDEKKEYEDKFGELIDKQDRLDKLIESYEKMNKDIEVRKKIIKLKSKEAEALAVAHGNQVVDKILKEIKHTKEEEKAIQAAVILKQKKEEAIKELNSIKMEVFAKEIEINQHKIKVGSFVKLRNGTSSGQIVNIDKNIAELEIGFMKMKVPLIELIAVGEPIEVNTSSKRIVNVANSNMYNETKIDIREYPKQDALRMLQNFLDKALLSSVYELKIIHGIGSGVLKKEVKKMLREYKDIKEIWHPDPEQGGEGITFVRF